MTCRISWFPALQAKLNSWTSVQPARQLTATNSWLQRGCCKMKTRHARFFLFRTIQLVLWIRAARRKLMNTFLRQNVRRKFSLHFTNYYVIFVSMNFGSRDCQNYFSFRRRYKYSHPRLETRQISSKLGWAARIIFGSREKPFRLDSYIVQVLGHFRIWFVWEQCEQFKTIMDQRHTKLKIEHDC